jgi:peptidoglycan hydrolase-like amidase
MAHRRMKPQPIPAFWPGSAAVAHAVAARAVAIRRRGEATTA